MDNFTLKVYITNLGKYNEGELIGEWIELPIIPEKFKEVLNHIEINKQYEEWFITDYDCSIDGLTDILGEYENLDELNYLASRIDEMDAYDLECFETIVSAKCFASNLKDLINLTYNLENYEYLEGVFSEYDLGYYWIEESGQFDLSSFGSLRDYINYEAYGHDVYIENLGSFTDNGYISEIDSISEVYNGIIESIPDEYLITCCTKEK